MGEIEGQEETKLNSTANATGTGATDAPALTDDELAGPDDLVEAVYSDTPTDAEAPDSATPETPLRRRATMKV